MRILTLIVLLVMPTFAREPLSERVARTDPSSYRKIKSVHHGAGELHYQGLLDSFDLGTNFLFLHRGVVPPKGGIGHHFHHQIEEMYVIFDNEAEFTINGRTSTLKGPAGAPCKMGQAHAIYNSTDEPTEWMNIAVSSVKGKYDIQYDERRVVKRSNAEGERLAGSELPSRRLQGGGPLDQLYCLCGVTARNGKNRTLSHQHRSANALDRRPCGVSMPSLPTPFAVRVFPLPTG